MVPGHPCTVPNDPINGHKNCTEDERAVHCTLACQHGFAFAFRPAGDYTCLLDQSEVSTGSRDLLSTNHSSWTRPVSAPSWLRTPPSTSPTAR